jgi:hypothetical protein
MPTNVYFNTYGSISEQRLVEDLMVEAIKIYGVDCYYVPMSNEEARDYIYGEDPLKTFSSSYPLEMYVQNVDGYQGEREFFSKFGLEIRNNMTVLISKRSFARWIPHQFYVRPREGDLIYIPFLSQFGEMYEIKYVDYSSSFYVLGNKNPYFYKLELEKFKYSQEEISTGIGDIDVLASQDAYGLNVYLDTGAGDFIGKEIVYQTDDMTFANSYATAIVADWNSPNTVITVTNIQGIITPNTYIYGSESGAAYVVIGYDTLDNPQIREPSDNLLIKQEANTIIDFSESNPFGSIS